MNILQIKSGMNLFYGLNKFKKSSISNEDENSNFSNFKEAHQKSKFKLDTKKSLLILGLFLAFFSNPLKAQTFFFTPAWGSAPCSVNFKVFNSIGTLLLSGDSNSIKFPIRNPPTQINCFNGIPDYVEYTVGGYLFNPIVVPINNSVAVSLPCLGGAFYNFTAYFTPSGLGCPQETLILNY
jgi:hypothetical protein